MMPTNGMKEIQLLKKKSNTVDITGWNLTGEVAL